jgi:hypothetical protein
MSRACLVLLLCSQYPCHAAAGITLGAWACLVLVGAQHAASRHTHARSVARPIQASILPHLIMASSWETSNGGKCFFFFKAHTKIFS